MQQAEHVERVQGVVHLQRRRALRQRLQAPVGQFAHGPAGSGLGALARNAEPGRVLSLLTMYSAGATAPADARIISFARPAPGYRPGRPHQNPSRFTAAGVVPGCASACAAATIPPSECPTGTASATPYASSVSPRACSTFSKVQGDRHGAPVPGQIDGEHPVIRDEERGDVVPVGLRSPGPVQQHKRRAFAAVVVYVEGSHAFTVGAVRSLKIIRRNDESALLSGRQWMNANSLTALGPSGRPAPTRRSPGGRTLGYAAGDVRPQWLPLDSAARQDPGVTHSSEGRWDISAG